MDQLDAGRRSSAILKRSNPPPLKWNAVSPVSNRWRYHRIIWLNQGDDGEVLGRLRRGAAGLQPSSAPLPASLILLHHLLPFLPHPTGAINYQRVPRRRGFWSAAAGETAQHQPLLPPGRLVFLQFLSFIRRFRIVSPKLEKELCRQFDRLRNDTSWLGKCCDRWVISAVESCNRLITRVNQLVPDWPESLPPIRAFLKQELCKQLT